MTPLDKATLINKGVIVGTGVRINHIEQVNLYGCTIGDNVVIGSFVEIQKGAAIGSNCKISSHSFICTGVTIEDEVFIGHNVTFVNDKYPRASKDGKLQTEEDWMVTPTLVKKGASIGSGSVIMCGITIEENAIIGSGSVVIDNIPIDEVWAGNPARCVRRDYRYRTKSFCPIF